MVVFVPSMATSAKDEASIKSLLTSISTFVDTRDFDSLMKLYTEEIEISSLLLRGRNSKTKSSYDIVYFWSEVLGSFDQSLCAIKEVKVSNNRETATALAVIDFEYWIDGFHRKFSCNLIFRLKKESTWKINEVESS